MHIEHIITGVVMLCVLAPVLFAFGPKHKPPEDGDTLNDMTREFTHDT